MLKKLLGSVNTRFLLFFLGAFFFSLMVSAVVMNVSLQGYFQTVLRQSITSRAEHVRTLSQKESIPVEEAAAYLTAADIQIQVYPDRSVLPFSLTEDEDQDIADGKVVFQVLGGKTLSTRGIAGLDGHYLVLSPQISRYTAGVHTPIQRTLLLLPMFLGSLLVVVVTFTIIRPINAISAAAQKVAAGDLDVTVDVRGYDEITELARNFNMMTRELQAREYLHKDFVSNVSHEFKTPVTSLKGYVKLLKDRNLPEEQRQEFYDIIISESDRLANLSANLLKLAELDQNNGRVHSEEFSLTEQLRGAIILLQSEWEKKSLELELELPDITISANADLLYQVWINLLDNAIRYTPQGGRIRVDLSTEPGSTVVQISDSGEGMTPEEMERIFDRFYQVDHSRSRGGTGLGLSIARKIVEIHGGAISVESIPGVGSTFTVRLPSRG